jgi:hypothetical protein
MDNKNKRNWIPIKIGGLAGMDNSTGLSNSVTN